MYKSEKYVCRIVSSGFVKITNEFPTWGCFDSGLAKYSAGRSSSDEPDFFAVAVALTTQECTISLFDYCLMMN